MDKNDLPAKYNHIRLLEIPYVTDPPWVDGDLSDPAWEKALALEEFMDITGWIDHFNNRILTNPRQFEPEPTPSAADPATKVLCCHDGARLYMGFICHDSAPENILQRDIRQFGYNIELEDCVYIWLDPDFAHLQPYSCEHIINAAGQKTERMRGHTSEGYDSLMAWEGRVRMDGRGCTALGPARFVRRRQKCVRFKLRPRIPRHDAHPCLVAL